MLVLIAPLTDQDKVQLCPGEMIKGATTKLAIIGGGTMANVTIPGALDTPLAFVAMQERRTEPAVPGRKVMVSVELPAKITPLLMNHV
jgi:6,7-dimethyl-8-ribityllumazine synthase